ncbi:carboxylate-amine ligase [Nonomuraea muscovyensis]|uniref:Putative glutamate--cysteine ligase 2 n=1 Tax=Nonomuraea muscovyensis TaxID=1124761 RepID=A0A7X0BZY4_9ACTN|nr:glutamate--cysteine ligase [Nonomuraea muscovyensis]MBB6344606.1 carboxylate-amine ligase [Nonomuraea muscovyensis]MDF2707790.1 glutamate--cysteine ligase [Nonomuraea muscovyensis]
MIGIEEEYFVVDPRTRHVVPRAAEVLAAATDVLDVEQEVTRFQVEARTAPSPDLSELGARLRVARKEVAGAARSCGLAVVASGIPVLGDVMRPPLSDDVRYEQGRVLYRALQDEISICALHVHVDVPDEEHAVYVGNHLRPWLPTLIALAANSPFFVGRDTGYASWRVISWGRWPVAGAPPYFPSFASYEGALRALSESGALMDAKTVYWDARPSSRLPTVEVRVADVPLDVSDSLTLIGLIRALVVTALADVTRGDRGLPIPSEVLRAAYWRAARDGLAGDSLDVRAGTLVPAPVMAGRLLHHVRRALAEAGDLAFVEEGLGRLLGRGSGAMRQRQMHARHGHLAGVVDDLIEATVA